MAIGHLPQAELFEPEPAVESQVRNPRIGTHYKKRQAQKAKTLKGGNPDQEELPLPTRKPGRSLPMTRGECANEQRPCPYVSCRHHLYSNETPLTGDLSLTYPELNDIREEFFPGVPPEKMPKTCSLDQAARGGLKSKTVAKLMNVSTTTIENIEAVALRKFKNALRRLGINPDDIMPEPK